MAKNKRKKGPRPHTKKLQETKQQKRAKKRKQFFDFFRTHFVFSRKRVSCFAVFWVVLLLLLAWGFVKEEKEITTDDSFTGESTVGELYSDSTVSQYFSFSQVGVKLKSVRFLVATYGDTLTSQGMKFCIYDKNEKKLFEKTISSEDLADNTWYGIDISKGISCGWKKQYYFTVSGLDAAGEDVVAPTVWTSTHDDGVSSDLYINGDKQEQKINVVYTYTTLKGKVFSQENQFGLLITVFLLMICFWNRLGTVTTKKKLLVTLVMMVGNVILLQGLTSYLAITEFSMTMTTRVVTSLLLLLLELFVFGLTGHVTAAVITTQVVYVLFVIADYFVVQYRGTPIVPADVLALGTLTTVGGTYQYRLSCLQWEVILICLCLCAFCIRLQQWGSVCTLTKRWRERKTLLLRMGCIVLGVAGVTLLSTSSVQNSLGVADNDQWDRMTGYSSLGPLLKFVSNTKYMTISKPKGYKTAKADEILLQYEESQAEQDAQDDTTEPNIIMIMNESLADFSEAEESSNISFSTDPLTYFHSMEENTIKGNCYVSAFGGGTANSELEALTGNSMAFFPQGSIVYQVFEKSFIAGMATDLQNLGYTSVVMHPNVSSSWNRSNVYSAMGFSSFLSLEYFENPEYVRSWNWVSDHSTYEKIIDLYEEKDEDTPLFVMDVTMQGHGGYDTASEWETKVTVSGGDFPKAEEYLSSTYVSDKAFQSLIEYFEKQDEPTVILMFGDHQPAVETEFYEALYGTSEESDLSLTQEYYKTPYVLWANYDIEEETKDLSANQLGILAKQVAGVSLTSYDQFVVDFSETIPILNALGYQDTDGNWWSLKKYPSDEYKQLLTNYSYVQYRRYCEWNK